MGLRAVESKPGLAGTRLRLRITDFNFCPAPGSNLRSLDSQASALTTEPPSHPDVSSVSAKILRNNVQDIQMINSNCLKFAFRPQNNVCKSISPTEERSNRNKLCNNLD